MNIKEIDIEKDDKSIYQKFKNVIVICMNNNYKQEEIAQNIFKEKLTEDEMKEIG